MDDFEPALENEREWRRHLLKEVKGLRSDVADVRRVQGEHAQQLAKMSVWVRIGQMGVIAFVGFCAGYLKDKVLKALS